MRAERILILGASGLIGGFLAADLARRGFAVVPAARRFPAGARPAHAVEMPLVDLSAAELAALLGSHGVDLVINCIGVLQDGPDGKTSVTHAGFVGRLLKAISLNPRRIGLIHFSVPGDEEGDRTGFSRSKREADRSIAASDVPHIILRPGFVLAPNAYGGSALLRALAALPFRLPKSLSTRPFQAVAMEDIAETVARMAERWPGQSAVWDLVHPQRTTLGDVIGSLRNWLGGPPTVLPLPGLLLDLGARLGDLSAWLGWAPPVRSTPLAELRRGVEGDPGAWIAATGIAPRGLDAQLAVPATIQERWFARLYLLKPLLIGSLVVFWMASGLIAMTVAFRPAAAILTSHGIASGTATLMTVASSLMDIAVGIAIAFRRTARAGLLAGIAVSLFYMVAAALLTPDLWIEPLGALVKTLPAMVLMLVGLAMLPNR